MSVHQGPFSRLKGKNKGKHEKAEMMGTRFQTTILVAPRSSLTEPLRLLFCIALNLALGKGFLGWYGYSERRIACYSPLYHTSSETLIDRVVCFLDRRVGLAFGFKSVEHFLDIIRLDSSNLQVSDVRDDLINDGLFKTAEALRF